MSEKNPAVLELTATIVTSYVGHNSVPPGELSSLISSTYAALDGLGGEPEAPPAARLVPAVPIRKSVTPEAIICLEDGKSFKSLKRHLSSKFGLTPEQYRTKWGLPADYPMIAPAYAERRSALAKSIGLGRKTGVTSSSEWAAAEPKKKRGRPPKAK